MNDYVYSKVLIVCVGQVAVFNFLYPVFALNLKHTKNRFVPVTLTISDASHYHL